MRLKLLLVCVLVGITASHAQEKPYWYDAMKEVNTKFDGNPGYIAQFGDSITMTRAFWTTIGWSYPDKFLEANGIKDKLPKTPKGKRWRDYIKGVNAKGAENGNLSGRKVGWLLKAIDKPLKKENPEVALVMIGTNDISGGKVPGNYKATLEKVIEKILAHDCIPVLNTIPPRRNRMKAVEECNKQIKEVAMKYKVPLIDYCAEILKRRPKDWDGTLISKDGVHPTAGGGGKYDPETLNRSGYQLRTWVSWVMVRELYGHVLSAPKPFVERVETVETSVRPGIRCAVTADTQVSNYKSKGGKGDNEQIWNWGKATRIKNKGYEELCMFKFDTSKCKGMTIKRASLYLSRTNQCVMNVVEVSTISTDWEEGTGTGGIAKDGATFTHAVYPDKPWAGPGSNLKFVAFGSGGSICDARASTWAKINTQGDRPDFYVVDLPLDIAQSLLVDGDSYGLVVVDGKGQRGFQKSYRRVPNPNHFLNSRESNAPCFLVIEGEKKDSVAPAAVGNIAAAPGKEAGDIILSWTCPGDDGNAGGKVLGYDVYVTKAGGKRTKLPRHLTFRPGAPGSKQSFWIDDLAPSAEYTFEVVAYDEAGNRSKAATVKGNARAARELALKMPDLTIHKGSPITKGNLRLFACPSTMRVSPVTGNTLLGGSYTKTNIDPYRNGNSVWNGKKQAITLSSGSNDFAAFQLILENTGTAPLKNIGVRLGQLAKATANAQVDKLVLMNQTNPLGFQNAIRELMAKDRELAKRVFADVKQLNAYRQMQKNDPMAHFEAMEALKKKDAKAYARWMFLIGGGKGKGGSAIDMKHSRIFWEWSISNQDKVYYPEALMPFKDSISIPNKENPIAGQRCQALFVDVFIPHKTAPGKYMTELTISADGIEPFTVPIDLRVHDFELPDKLTFVAEMNAYLLDGAYGDWDGYLNMQKLAHRNRLHLNVVPYSHSANFTMPNMDLGAEGSGANVHLTKISKIDKFYGPMLTGKLYKDNPRKGVPVAGCYLPLYENWPLMMNDNGFKFDQEGKSADIRKDFPKAYKDGWVKAARQLFKHLESKGYDQTVFHLFLNNKYQYAPEITFWWLDEPMFRDDFVAIDLFGDLTRKAMAGINGVNVDYRIDVSRIQEARDLMNTVDLLVLSQSNLRDFPTVARNHMRMRYEKRPNGKPVTPWVYGGNSSADSTNVTNRFWCTESYLLGMKGILPWLSVGKDSSWDSTKSARNTVFFPARRWEINGALGSLRMKSFRDGQQDAEYLELLRKRLGATREEVREMVNSFVSIKATTEMTFAEDAGTVKFKNATPDKVELLRRILGHNIELAR